MSISGYDPFRHVQPGICCSEILYPGLFRLSPFSALIGLFCSPNLTHSENAVVAAGRMAVYVEP
jgi:hypothetical protein